MSENALRKLWTFFAAAGLLFSTYAFLKNVGVGKVNDPSGGLLEYGPNAVPLFAVPIQAILLLFTLGVTLLWMRKQSRPLRRDRFPVFYFDRTDVDPAAPGGCLYQVFAFTFFLLIPFVATARMTWRFFEQQIYYGETTILAHWTDYFAVCNIRAKRGMGPDDILWYGYYFQDAHEVVSKGPEYLCGYAWIVTLLVLGLVVMWVWATWRIIK